MRRCPSCNLRFDDTMSVCPHDRTPLVDLPDPLVGRTLAGRYRVERRIGVGGMGTVYLAQHLLLRRQVAIKLLAPELTRDPVMRERFIREAQATNLLKHPNIVDIWDVAEEGARVFLVMEYLQGVALAERLASGPLSVREAMEVVVPVAQALERAHSLHVVHRDVKPENVFLCRDEIGAARVKVLDFGIVHIKSEARLTGPGEIFGTPEYMAPEQSRGEPCGPATDLYAVGVMLFEMLTGVLPFNGAVSQLPVLHARTPAPRVSSRVRDVAPVLDDLVADLLRKDPAERPRDATALLERLQVVLQQVAPELAAGDSGVTPRAQPSGAFSAPPRVTADEVPETERSSTIPGTPSGDGAMTVATLRQHRAMFAAALAAAHPRGDAPAWVTEAVEALDAKLEALQDRDDARRALTIEAAERARRGQRARDRLVDEWKKRSFERDEETARLLALETRLTQLGRDLDAALGALRAAWPLVGSAPIEADTMSAERAVAMETAGQRASRWRRVALEHAATQGEFDAVRAEVEAMVAHELGVKERVEQIHDEAARQRVEIDERLATLAAEVATEQHAVQRLADRIARYLAEFPSARPIVSWPVARERAAG